MTLHTDIDAQRLMEAIQLLVRRFSLAERADVACCGMTVAQAATLEVLANGPLRLGALGVRLGIAPSTLSRNLDRLVERGFVDRGPDPDDRRAQRAELTAEGHKAAASVDCAQIEFAHEILRRLRRSSSTIESLNELLTAVRAATESCCPGAYEHLIACSDNDVSERRKA